MLLSEIYHEYCTQASFHVTRRLTILVARFVRSLPKLDDLLSILTDIRKQDSICKDLGQIFCSKGW